MRVNLADLIGVNLTNKNISIRNNKVYVNGKRVDDLSDCPDKEITLVVEGNVGNVDISGNLECKNVNGDIDCSGSVHCGDVTGDIDCSGSVYCGNVSGDIDCAGSISMTR